MAPTPRTDGISEQVSSAVEAVLDFLLNILTWATARIETLPDRFNGWLARHRLTREEFQTKLWAGLGILAFFGIAVQWWGVLLGAAAKRPPFFWTILIGGLAIFGWAWFRGLFFCLWRINRGAAWLVFATSAFGGIVLLGGIVLERWDAGTSPANLFALTRGLVVMGFAFSLICLIPFMLGTRIIKALYALIANGAEAVAPILQEISEGSREQVQQALRRLRSLAEPTMSMMEKWVAAISIHTIVLLHFPTPTGVLAAFAILAAVLTILLGIRKPFGIKGYVIPKVLYAGAVAYLIGWLAKLGLHFLFQDGMGWHPVWIHSYLEFGIAAKFTLVVFYLIFRTCRITQEEEELREGKAAVDPFRLAATAVDPDTGKPKFGLKTNSAAQDVRRATGSVLKALLLIAAAGVVLLGMLLVWRSGVNLNPAEWSPKVILNLAAVFLLFAGAVLSWRKKSFGPLFGAGILAGAMLLWPMLAGGGQYVRPVIAAPPQVETSPRRMATVEIKIYNRGGRTLELWHAQENRQYATLRPGDGWSQQSFSATAWEVRVAGTEEVVRRIEKPTASIEIEVK